MRKTLARLIMTLLLLSLFTMLPNTGMVVARPGIIRVPQDYPKIQDAINAASPSDIVLVAPGIYYERVILDKPLTLMGSGRDITVIDGGGSGYVIQVAADNVTITGFTIRRGGCGVLLLGAGSVVNYNVVTNNSRIGVYLFVSNNNTISGNDISNNGEAGIALEYSNNNLIVENDVTNNEKGISLHNSNNNMIKNVRLTLTGYHHDGITGSGSNNTIDCNTIVSQEWFTCGISLSGSNNIISNNSLSGVYHGILLSGSNNTIKNNIVDRYSYEGIGAHGLNNIIYNNTVTGTGAWGSYGVELSGAGNTVDSNVVTNNGPYGYGIYVRGERRLYWEWPYLIGHNLIVNNTVANNGNGIGMFFDANSSIISNIIVSNTGRAIHLHYCTHTTIASNNIINNEGVGIHIVTSDQNIVFANILDSNENGIKLDGSKENMIDNNIVANSGWIGIHLHNSDSTTIINNNLTNNLFGIRIERSSGVIIYHNNFIENAVQAYNYPEGWINAWDNGYPSGGNYWSDYVGVDEFSGPCQDEPGSDGIGDAPYPIPLDNRDTYPLMEPWKLPVTPPKITLHDIAVIDVAVSFTQVYVGQVVDITVVVRNEGTVAETFNVTAYYNGNVLGVQTDVSIDPGKITAIKFSWNTTDITPGEYRIKASVSILPGEIDTADNTFIDGLVTVAALPPEAIRDIAIVDVVTSATEVNVGEIVVIAVTVRNEGTVAEIFSVNTYYDTNLIGARMLSLPSGGSVTLSFVWGTIRAGNFTIKAVVPPVPGEVDTADNEFIDGVVRVMGPIFVHDIAITDVKAFPIRAAPGDLIKIIVTVENQGDFPENFTVTTYYNDIPAAPPQKIVNLAAKESMILNFTWNTTGVSPGTYVIKAEASILPDEVDIKDNTFINGAVTLAHRILTVKLSGEFDYTIRERVRIKVAALVKDAISMEPVSNATVTIEIYDDTGRLWLSGSMIEKPAGTGIYQWTSNGTIFDLQLSRGIYLVRVKASYKDGPPTYDILLFHISPPAEGKGGESLYYAASSITALSCIAMIMLRKKQIVKKLRGLSRR